MSLVLKLEIALGNDAMESGADVSDSIRKSLPTGTSMLDAMVVGDAAPIMDGNGNTVGRWYVDAV